MVELATEFAELAAQIRGEGSEDAQWRRIGELAVQHVPGCTWASITDVHAGRKQSLAASDPIAATLDHLQYDADEGPCLESATADASVLCTDLHTEQRWPRFVTQAREQTAARSVLAIRVPGHDSAAMNFYSDRPDAFDDAAIAAGSILAAHAAGLLAVGESTAQTRNLEVALGTSRQIGMAIGVLMAYHKIGQEEAFGLLRMASQVLHRKIRDIAAEVAETGTLPALPRRPSTAAHAGQWAQEA
jgi:ANTAR domain-containing protein/GAF domain-containing protein